MQLGRGSAPDPASFSARGLLPARRIIVVEILDDVRGLHSAFAVGMPESAGAEAVCVVQNHVVVVAGAGSHGDMIESQPMPHFPGDDVIRAGGVAAVLLGNVSLAINCRDAMCVRSGATRPPATAPRTWWHIEQGPPRKICSPATA